MGKSLVARLVDERISRQGKRIDDAVSCIYTFMHMNVFDALADPTRRRIVSALRHGELPVNDIVERAGIHQSGVSRHLRILHGSGFVAVRPEGQRRIYALRPEPFREIDAWLGEYREVWDARLDRSGAALKERREAPDGTKKAELK
ncbi:MAG: ArsR family transcriptional regulator [Rhodospirillales bacterium]|jgi:DNA-binding transcriptional ArsR family regulator|nr:ArsR family transcriptional regulator [Rhodospirillales bacterium]